MGQKRIHVFYSGRVQGVGFRYTAQDIAMGMDLTGWAKNLLDGRVEVVIEGDEKKLKEFLDKISKGHLGSYIRDADVSWEKSENEFDSFNIEF